VSPSQPGWSWDRDHPQARTASITQGLGEEQTLLPAFKETEQESGNLGCLPPRMPQGISPLWASFPCLSCDSMDPTKAKFSGPQLDVAAVSCAESTAQGCSEPRPDPWRPPA
jgi:hypothetical protein